MTDNDSLKKLIDHRLRRDLLWFLYNSEGGLTLPQLSEWVDRDAATLAYHLQCMAQYDVVKVKANGTTLKHLRTYQATLEKHPSWVEERIRRHGEERSRESKKSSPA